MASVGPSPKVRNLANTSLMLAMLAAISSSPRNFLASSLPDGSPTLVVPPPISTIGLWPVFCNSLNNMIDTRDPACRLGAVQSKPI